MNTLTVLPSQATHDSTAEYSEQVMDKKTMASAGEVVKTASGNDKEGATAVPKIRLLKARPQTTHCREYSIPTSRRRAGSGGLKTVIGRADFKNSDELYKYNIEQYLTQSLQPEIRKPRRTIKSSLRPRPSPGQGLEYDVEISKEDPTLCLDMSEILSSHNMKQHLHRGWQKRFMDETLSSYTRKAISKEYVQPIDASDYIGTTKDMDKMLIDHAKMHNNPNVLGVTNPHPHKMFFTRTAR